MLLHDMLQTKSRGADDPTLHDDLQAWGDIQMGSEGAQCESVEARMFLGVLRRVLAGGLLTNERVCRHRMDGVS